MIAFLQGEGSHEGGGYYFWRLKSTTLPPRDVVPTLPKSRLVTAPPLVCGLSNILRRGGRNRSSHQTSSVAENIIVRRIIYPSSQRAKLLVSSNTKHRGGRNRSSYHISIVAEGVIVRIIKHQSSQRAQFLGSIKNSALRKAASL